MLAEALRAAVHAQRFDSTPDRLRDGAAVGVFPGIDLAVVRFAQGGRRALAANVLFSREHPQGVAARFAASVHPEPVEDPGGAPPGLPSTSSGRSENQAQPERNPSPDQDRAFGAVHNLRFDADQRDAAGNSVAWLPGADWQRLRWEPLFTPPGLPVGAPRFVAPYPASLLKLMVAVGLGLAVDAGRLAWADAMPHLAPMITVSDNVATDRCVALLHRAGMVDTLKHTLREAWGLPTLHLNRTTPAGGWRNGDGSGVGQIHMTAWDTLRLLWIIDPHAPLPPWLPPGTPTLSEATKVRLLSALAAQQLDHILSSAALRGLPGWLPGLPDAPSFAHKTGSTENCASDAGIVATEGGLHYIVAVLTSLGSRYRPRFVGADDGRAATTWKLPALGAAVHALMETLP